MGAAAFLAQAAIASPPVPTVAAGAAPGAGDAAGYYRVLREPAAIGTGAPDLLVYWMPRGSAAAAPAAIKALPAYRDAAALGTLQRADMTFYGPDGAGVSPASADDCPANWLCLFRDSGWKGTMKQFSSNYWQHLSDFGFNDETSSVVNRRGTDAQLSDNISGPPGNNPSGTIRCFDSHSKTSGLGSFNDEASGVFVSALDTRC